MKLQFKTIDYKTLGGGDDEYIIKMEDFAKAKNVRIRSSSDGRPGVVWDPKRPNIVKLRGGLMVNGNYEHGYFKVSREMISTTIFLRGGW